MSFDLGHGDDKIRLNNGPRKAEMIEARVGCTQFSLDKFVAVEVDERNLVLPELARETTFHQD